jgi:hypothetical protein
MRRLGAEDDWCDNPVQELREVPRVQAGDDMTVKRGTGSFFDQKDAAKRATEMEAALDGANDNEIEASLRVFFMRNPSILRWVRERHV